MDIEEARKEIDRVNSEIVSDVAERMDVVSEIAEFKERNGMEIEDEEREKKVKQQFAEKFKDKGMPGKKGKELAEYLISLAKNYQRDRR
jgi:chorismate mutase